MAVFHPCFSIIAWLYSKFSYVLVAAFSRNIRSSGTPSATRKFLIPSASVYVYPGLSEALAKETLASVETGDMLRMQLSVLKKLTRSTPVDTVGLKRNIAARIVKNERYTV